MKVTLDVAAFKKSIKARLRADGSKMARIADKMKQQVDDRYATGGASGGQAWPATTTPLGHKPPLAGLENTWEASSTDGEAKVASNDIRTLWSHLGNIGKGGTRPDIVPVHAKALYIPLSELGRQSYEARKLVAPVVQRVFAGYATVESRGNGFKGAVLVGVREAVYGVDFIFAQKSSQPPRKQIPSAPVEQAALGPFVIQTLKS